VVVGLDLFTEHFRGYADRYVLIGGVATQLALEAAGVAFRPTKDLDIVLLADALDTDFVAHFWLFVRLGGYRDQQYTSGPPGGSKHRTLYRFQKPADPAFPAMLELFSRLPDAMRAPVGSNAVRIAVGDDASSLSAILMDDDYYALIPANRVVRGELPVLAEAALIVLKARAWLDLTERKANGELVDSKNIRKHAMDILRLAQLLTPATRFNLTDQQRVDMGHYLVQVAPTLKEVEALPGLGSLRVADSLAALAVVFGIVADNS
jgi:hypothetical protein